jgi:hypothetical protein
MLVTNVGPEPGEADPFYDASTWVDVLELAKGPTDIARIMAAQLQRVIDSRKLKKKDVAAVLGVDPGVLSRNVRTEPKGLSRAVVRLIDQHFPLDADYSMGALRDLYVLADDQGIRRVRPGATPFAVAQAATDSLLAGSTTGFLARSGRCFASSAVGGAPMETEPLDSERERLTYGFFTVSDPLEARAVAIRAFESSSGDLGSAGLLTVDHLMGRWDMCVKFKSPKSLDPNFLFDRLTSELRKADAFPHVTEGRQKRNKERKELLPEGDPRRLRLAVVVPVNSRVADPASSSALEKDRHYDKVRVRIPTQEDLDSNRLMRVFFYIDFHAVPDSDHRELMTDFAAICAEAQRGAGGLAIESINIGDQFAVLELTIGCGSMPALTGLNRAFERLINSNFTVQKYNMLSYDHMNLWASGRDQGEAGEDRVN